MIKIFSFLLIFEAILTAQILECRAIQDMRVGVQLAKYKFEPLFEAIANSFVLTSMYKEL